MTTPFIQVTHIEKLYDGVHALNDASVSIAPGEVHAIMGENGAGKSTLGKILAGVVAPEAGIIEMDGHPIKIADPRHAQRQGICMISQELDLFPHLTVAENIAIGNLHLESGMWVRFGQLEQQVRPFLDQVNLPIAASTMVGELPMGHMQLVAIARALSMQARLIVMDEPTSSLTNDAVANLFSIIRKLRDKGVAIVYVSHKMDEIFQIADRITVLRDGRSIGTREATRTDMNELIRMMVGRDISDERPTAVAIGADIVLTVDRIVTDKLRGVSFDLHAGEVLGVAGLVGAGRSELGAAIFGLDPIRSGSIGVRGRVVRPRGPRDAIRAGIGLLPEDRKLQGLMMQMSVRENMSLSTIARTQLCGFIRGKQERRAVESVQARTRIKAASPEATVSTLSGGNQQKALIARWLLVDPPILFLDDPTRGVDIGAKVDIYKIIRELSAKGKGVIFVSSELPELLQCCHRILVLHDGHSMGILESDDATQERIMELATRTVEQGIDR